MDASQDLSTTENMAEGLAFVVEMIGNRLPKNDLAKLSRVSHKLHEIVSPFLYQTVRFHNPGRIATEDALLQKLDIFGHPQFNQLIHTKKVLVTGSWYETYNDIESDIGPKKILSPAVRMFNNIVTSCILRMGNLKEFTCVALIFCISQMIVGESLTSPGSWDLQISMTQMLITSALAHPNIEFLQLRLGTDCTPKPFFHPRLDFHPMINVKVLKLLQLDDESVLEALSLAISSAKHLQELALWADETHKLDLCLLFNGWKDQIGLELRSLDLRGFTGLGQPSSALWKKLSPSKLSELTLHVGGHIDAAEYAQFWEASANAGLRLRALSTNLVVPGLTEFLGSFSGLELLDILASASTGPMEPLRPLIQCLQEQHWATLKVLGISPQGRRGHYLFSQELTTSMSQTFPELEELRLGSRGFTEDLVCTLLSCPKIAVLHLLRVAKYVAADGSKVGDDQRLLDFVLGFLRKGMAKHLRYIAFDDGPVYEILRRPVRALRKRTMIGYIEGTSLLEEKMFSWVKEI